MRVAHLSTWQGRCGIASYCEGLVLGLRETELLEEQRVVAMREGPSVELRAREHDGVAVTRPWTRDGRGFDFALDEITRSRADVVHIQHEHGLFLSPALLPTSRHLFGLMAQLRARRVALVVTLHTVGPYSDRAGFYDEMRLSADAIVVHGPRGRAALERARPSHARHAAVYQVPHGTEWPPRPGDPERGRAILGLPRPVEPDWQIVLVLGFMHRSKNLLGTIRSFQVAAPSCPPIALVIRGDYPDGDLYCERDIHEVAERRGREVHIQREWVDDADVPHLLSAATFSVINRDSPNYGASGQVHVAAPYVPLAVADRPIHHEAIAAGAVPFGVASGVGVDGISESCVDAIMGLSLSKELRDEVNAGLRSMSRDTKWSTLARSRYLPIYEEAVRRANR